MMPFFLRRFSAMLGLLAGAAAATLPGAAESAAPGPMEREFPIATVTALLRPAATQRVVATQSGKLRLMAAAGPVKIGALLARFEDAELRSALDVAQLRLRAAQQAEVDFIADAPARRQEAMTRISDLEGRLGMAEALAKNPALLHDLPASLQESLAHADPAALRAQLDAARNRAARLEAPGHDDGSTAHLQVLDAERAFREAEARLRESALTAPFSGAFQPALIFAGEAGAWVSAGQEVGTLRDLTRIIAAVPALSPYLARADLARTQLRITGGGGRTFDARFSDAVTEPSPVMGESRVFLYEFSEADSRQIAGMIQTNADAKVVLVLEEPVAVVRKLEAAMAHPDVFRDGWSGGVAKAWPGWSLVAEGENTLGLARTGAPTR
ncbi:MAG: hypothetical protein JWM88_2401 [Verrucomicrobia bacterium]|nr:hypothetical protein [Verrucomicrobiota bacterium]